MEIENSDCGFVSDASFRDIEMENKLKCEEGIHNSEVEIKRSIQKVKEMTAKYKFDDDEIKALSCLMARSIIKC